MSRIAPPPIPFSQVLAEELATIDRASVDAGAAGSESKAYEAVHGRTAPLSALCLSGGGIRSATFSLGVMQSLAHHGLLKQFDYLSTVSGGGYIGSWLTAWIHRKTAELQSTGAAIDRVSEELASANLGTEPEGKPGTGPVRGEAPPIVHLRRYSHYLAPRSGLFAADLWTLIATVLRNIVLNWIVLIPALVALLGLPRLFAVVAAAAPAFEWSQIVMNAAGLVLALAIAWVSRQQRLRVEARPNQNRVLLCGVGPVALGAVLFTIAWAWNGLDGLPFATATWQLELVPFGVGVMTAGWAMYQLSLLAPSKNVNDVPPIWESLLELVVYILTGAIGGVILRVVLHPFDASMQVFDDNDKWLLAYTTIAPAAFLSAFSLAASLFAGLASHLMSEEDREWWSRFGAWLLMASTAWTVVGTVTLLLPQLLIWAYALAVAGIATLGSGAITVLGGLSSKTLWKPKPSDAVPKSRDEKEASPSLSMAVQIALPLFVVLVAVALSLATDAVVHAIAGNGPLFDDLLHGAHVRLAQDSLNIWILAGAAAIGVLAAFCVGINTFSLHAMYRNRLIRAYLGASRGTRRVADKFIGFDQNDDMTLCSTVPPDKAKRPLFHIVNMALNLVGGADLAWQERKAESMTATSLHVGSYQLGYRSASEYGGGRKTLTLGTAMAISGAAASPNMGYHSSPVLTFILTLFNARLGWWLGNPGKAGGSTYRQESPFWALRPLFAEALGQTDSDHPYVYASDGGHFENLGMYEVVRRRCGFVVVVDAGADAHCGFEDLSNAIRKIRSDFGISIDLHYPRCVYARHPGPSEPAKGRYAITGEINYSDIDGPNAKPGKLIYIKPAYYNYREPIDVNNYANLSATFPHESTADQFFSESQFESYRALGHYETEELCNGCSGMPATLNDFWNSVQQHLEHEVTV
jgi:hypothetical protein